MSRVLDHLVCGVVLDVYTVYLRICRWRWHRSVKDHSANRAMLLKGYNSKGWRSELIHENCKSCLQFKVVFLQAHDELTDIRDYLILQSARPRNISIVLLAVTSVLLYLSL